MKRKTAGWAVATGRRGAPALARSVPWAAAMLPRLTCLPPAHPLTMPLKFPAPSAALLLSLACLTPAQAADRAHEHGAVQLELVVEPQRISLALDAPQDNLLGFERRPRSATEQQAAAAVLATLRAGAKLWAWPADWRCSLAEAEVDAPLLAPGAATKAAETGHADVEVHWAFQCARTGALRQLDIGPLLDAFARIQRVQAQVITPEGQFKASARRPARTLGWGR